MKEGCKTILVFHVGIKHLGSSDIVDYVNKISESLQHAEESVIQYILPVKDRDDIRIECINPQLVGPEGYKSVKDLLERLESVMMEFHSYKKQPESTPMQVVLSKDEVRFLFLGISSLHRTGKDGAWVRMAEVLDGMACGLSQADADAHKLETPYQLIRNLLTKEVHVVLEKFLGFDVKFTPGITPNEESVLQLLSPNKVLTTLKQIPDPTYGFKPSSWEVIGVHR